MPIYLSRESGVLFLSSEMCGILEKCFHSQIAEKAILNLPKCKMRKVNARKIPTPQPLCCWMTEECLCEVNWITSEVANMPSEFALGVLCACLTTDWGD